MQLGIYRRINGEGATGSLEVDSRSSDRGFTLIETMIALFVLSVGLLGLLTLSVTTSKMNFKARRIYEAASTNADRQEKLMALAYDNAVLASGSTTTVVDGQYTTTWSVSAAGLPIPNVKTVTITTQWEENGQVRNLQYVYYKADSF